VFDSEFHVAVTPASTTIGSLSLRERARVRGFSGVDAALKVFAPNIV